ncbi:hypothetical protein GALMADRAFT_280131 [Galerina marginata CBS 339.88]|uniref:DUF6534 domain-containing protein n=1 Tax=Galerina marginata (strain CBS 339.88) TaxID=685588 RepID=A0A067SX69_GALM3|nr:hypothetical protein GALMADRAFT_280131 [Galerina marginata CBS 339.88]
MNLLVTLFGAGQLGVVFNAWMVGLVCAQGYSYYLNFPSDTMVLKILVAWVLVIQIFNLFIQTTTMYHYLIVSFGNYDKLFEVAWEWSLYLGLIAVGACSVQLFYAYRIFRLSHRRNYVICGIIVILALAALGLCSAVMILALTTDTNFDKITGTFWLVQAWLCVDGACDLLIAVVQVYYLYRQRCGLPRTMRFVNILILYFISTGLLTSILVIFELISVNLDARRYKRLMDSSSDKSATSGPQTGTTKSLGELRFKVTDNEFSEMTSSRCNTSIPISEPGIIGTSISPQPENSSTGGLNREARDSRPTGRGNEDKVTEIWA